MANLFDYLDWRGDLTVAQAPVNCVDSLILCCLSYVPLEGALPPGARLTVAQAAKILFDGGLEVPAQRERLDFKSGCRMLLSLLADSPRFRDMELFDYVNHIDPEAQTQFSAVTVDMGAAGTYVAFRGTDNTLVGWKEDFNMGFLCTVPAQREAAEYLERAARQTKGPLWTGGHSKGGNLAVYAAAHCAAGTRKRLAGVFNNDGPGFCAPVLEEPGYQAVRGKISTFVPQSSVVGMLLDHEEEYTVVRSTQVGLLQHDPYSWQVLGRDFIRLDAVTSSSRFLDQTLKSWIAAMDVDQRELFVDTLFEVLGATNAGTLAELGADWFKNAGVLLQKLRDVDDDTRKAIAQVLGLLLQAAKESFPALYAEK